MNDQIIKDITEQRNGMYVHALEVSDVYELDTIIESLISEFEQTGYNKQQVLRFFNTISLYCLCEQNEEEVYSYSFTEAIEDLWY